MKFLRCGPPGQETPAVVDEQGNNRDLSSIINDIDTTSLPTLHNSLRGIDVSNLPVLPSSSRIGPCITGTRKFICIGLNYSDHARETGQEIPGEPVIFMKATSAISGPNDPIQIPRGSKKTDWEVELGVVIGREAKYVDKSSALDYVAGFCVINDVSEREFQNEHFGQWTKGKSCDSFGPIGPWLVTPDEIADPQNLHMWLEVNGHRYQDGNTSTMVYDVAHLVSYLSHFMRLEPGDVISTGTPPGVGIGLKEPTFLKPGDKITLEIDGLGRQTQDVVQG